MITSVGAPWCFIVNAITFILVALAISGIGSTNFRAERSRVPKMASYGTAWSLVLTTPAVGAALLSGALISAFTYEFPVTLPLLTSDVYGAGPESYGVLLAVSGAGSILGGLKAAGDVVGRWSLPISASVLGACVLATAFTPSLMWGLATLFLTGAVSTQFITVASSMLFAGAPQHLRGRLSAFWQMASMGTTVLGGPLIGYFADAYGVQFALGVGAAAALCGGLLAAFILRAGSGTNPNALPRF